MPTLINDKLYPWYMAQMRKIAVTSMTLGMLWATYYWKTWAEVMFGVDRAPKG